jgi:glycosyltransferase involved in cell wall biosynthesis
MTALHYDRAHSMESRLSWQRAQHAAADFDVTVICAHGEAGEAGARLEGVQVVELAANRLERWLMAWEILYYLGYRMWHRRVHRLARRLHAERPFALVHQVSLCGYREPSDCWRLGAPFVWGPIGGTRPFPLKFLGQLDLRGAWRELLRNVVNACQLRLDVRIRRAVNASACVLAANREIAGDIRRRFGRTPRVQLETGVDQIRSTPRPPRDVTQPLKILWTGRLRSWKALPLLLHALAQLPNDRPYVLRVLGEGNCLRRWRRLAKKLRIEGHIEWLGWCSYQDQQPHNDWADVFAFTSLRDTSGAGLLEALAAGAPIVGIDHQGAADIMTHACAVRVPATSASAAIAGFRDAIATLAGDAAALARLSDGALERASQFHWDWQAMAMQGAYEDALGAAPAASPLAPREATPLVPAGAGQAGSQEGFWRPAETGVV